MNRAKALKILNPILAVIFLCQVCTGLLHKYIFYKVYDMVHGGGGDRFACSRHYPPLSQLDLGSLQFRQKIKRQVR